MLSVVVPFYGVEDFLAECLQSLQQQALKDAEFILVDDGSPDGSRQIAERFVAADERFSLIRQENAGLGPARNTGAAAARGKYLAFVDSDDMVAGHGFYRLVESLESSGSDIAAGGVERFTRERGSYPSWTHEGLFLTPSQGILLSEQPGLAQDRMVWNKVYRRAFWEDLKLEFPAIRYEDYPVTLPAYWAAKGIDIVPETVYFWRDREGGTSITQQSASVANAQDRHESASLVLDYLTRESVDAGVHTSVNNALARVDLVTLLRASAAAQNRAEQSTLRALATDLAQRLNPRFTEKSQSLAKGIHAAAKGGEIALAETLAMWPLHHDPQQLLRAFGQAKHRGVALLAARNVALSQLPQTRGRRRPLKVAVSATGWESGALRLMLEARIRRQFAHGASVRVVLVNGTGTVVGEASVLERSVNGSALNLIVLIPADRVPLDGDPVRVRVDIQRAGLTWSGAVWTQQEHLAAVGQCDGRTSYLTRADGVLEVRSSSTARVGGVTFTEHAVRLMAPSGVDRVRIERPAPAGGLDVELSPGPDGSFQGSIAWNDLLASDVTDNPVTHSRERRVVAEGCDGELPFLINPWPNPVKTAFGSARLVPVDQGGVQLRLETR